jgi:hypothetical protein
MAAPKGNQFWLLRSKHGRDKIFSSPDVLWDAACEYFQWCEDNPLIELDFRGKDAVPVELPKMRAFTWSGLELFLHGHELKNYRNNPAYEDYFQILTRIEQVMYNQKFTGAAVNMLNPSIIARDLGLKEQTDNTNTNTQPTTVNFNFADMSGDKTEDE